MQIQSLQSALEKVGSLENKLVDLELQLEKRKSELLEIARVGALITSFLELDGILSSMMEMSLRLLHAEVGCIIVWDKEKGSHTKISWGIDYKLVKMLKLEGEIDIAQWTKDTGETVIINDFPPGLDIPAMVSSVIAAPLNCRNETIGVLIAVNKTDEEGFSEGDNEILETLVNFATVAIENAKLFEESLIKQKLESELALAKEVQKALLPSAEVKIAGAQLAHVYFPAGQVGGDYYDIIPISGKKFVVIMGDVSNKGMPAALMMTAVRSVVRHEVRLADVKTIMSNVNQTLCQDVMRRDGMFITLFLARFDLENNEMTYSNAGHLPPFFYNPARAEIQHLKTGGVILGQFEDSPYQSETIKLCSGDRLLCYTDGITECENGRGDMFGRGGLMGFVDQNKSVDEKEFLRKLKAAIDDFVNSENAGQSDDITAVLVKIQ